MWAYVLNNSASFHKAASFHRVNICLSAMACVSEVEVVDLRGVVSDLRAELAQVKKDLSVVREENSHLKEIVEGLCSGGSDNNSGDNNKEKWEAVKGKGRRFAVARRRRNADSQLCVGNSFSLLQDECVDTGKADDVSQPSGKSLQIVGDSLCRYLGRAVKSKVGGTFCFPGAGVGQVVKEIDHLADSSKVSCIIAGGNDIHKRRSEELVKKYIEALEKVRMKGGIAIACGILPRRGHGREWASRALGFNDRMEKYCKENGIGFIDTWDTFSGRRNLFARDGIHLSRSGVTVLARLVDQAVAGFC